MCTLADGGASGSPNTAERGSKEDARGEPCGEPAGEELFTGEEHGEWSMRLRDMEIDR